MEGKEKEEMGFEGTRGQLQAHSGLRGGMHWRILMRSVKRSTS